MAAPHDDKILKRQIYFPGMSEQQEVFLALNMRRLGGWINKGQHREIKNALFLQANLGISITLKEMEMWYERIVGSTTLE